jgi:hypothetical protein
VAVVYPSFIVGGRQVSRESSNRMWRVNGIEGLGNVIVRKEICLSSQMVPLRLIQCEDGG